MESVPFAYMYSSFGCEELGCSPMLFVVVCMYSPLSYCLRLGQTGICQQHAIISAIGRC